MSDSIVARRDVLVVWPDGHVEPGNITVAKPLERDGVWWCAMTTQGFPFAFGPIAGEDALQCLTLALIMLRRELAVFLASGGALQDAEGDTWPLEVFLPSM